MYLEYYGLKEQPFGVTPNPRYLYLTPTHCEAMASIMYGLLENRGFTALIAEPGMGKTTLLYDLLQRCSGSFRTAFLFQFQCSPEGLLRNLLAELGVDTDTHDFTSLQAQLNEAILAEAKNGKRIAVVIDEAQNFTGPVLEVLRMLSNFETTQEKLIHIILAGQPQLAEILLEPSIVQLRQRISIAAMLRPLNAQQTRDYINHRLSVAGYSFAEPIFSESSYQLIARESKGIPRNINNICFNAMSLGCATGQRVIERELIMEVARDLSLERSVERKRGEERERARREPGAAGARVEWARVEPSKVELPKQRVRPQIPPPSSGFSLQPPRARTTGRRLGFAAKAIAVVGALCAGGLLVNQYVGRKAANSIPRVEAAVVPAAEPSSAAPNGRGEAGAEMKGETRDEAKTEAKPEDARSSGQPLPAASTETKPDVDGVRTVKVRPNQTLYDLCISEVGKYDERTVRAIQKLNPWLRNPKQLRPGQVVRLPAGEISSKRREKLVSAVATMGEKR